MKGKCILIISPEAWGKNFVSKHHYASHLSEANTVYFLNPPQGSNKLPFKSIRATKQKVSESLVLLDYVNLLPRLNDMPKKIRESFYKKQARQIRELIDLPIDIVWSFDPYRFQNQRVWTAKTSIYHAMDLHLRKDLEMEIIFQSDFVFSISKAMTDEIESSCSKEFYVTGHGFDFQNKNETKVILPGENKLKAVYIGNISKFIHQSCFKLLAQKNPTIDFIMIGPTAHSNLSKTKLKTENYNLSNVHFIGEISFYDIPNYLRECDINFLIYPQGTPAFNSHKLMQYFYSGHVTISYPLRDYENCDPDLITIVNSEDELIENFILIAQNIEEMNSFEKQKLRRNFALNNTYQKKIEQIDKLIKQKNKAQ